MSFHWWYFFRKKINLIFILLTPFAFFLLSILRLNAVFVCAFLIYIISLTNLDLLRKNIFDISKFMYSTM